MSEQVEGSGWNMSDAVSVSFLTQSSRRKIRAHNGTLYLSGGLTFDVPPPDCTEFEARPRQIQGPLPVRSIMWNVL